MSGTVAAITENTLKTMALGISGGSLLIALILLKVVKSVVGKIISTAVFAAIAFAGYSQRQAITDCADKVRERVDAVQSGETKKVAATCTFFGRDFSINVDVPIG